ncbi:hypothetical protein EVAR_49259_1 [Eumeta japonica]|uniref:Uncharacterized protein n=1 Tax=Eumeta variegata TaxID=151549 RepID=A0A4C1YG89_EUMVA|nr:hypothetical protein EVAR_49259_1 [Eumeta japonica]
MLFKIATIYGQLSCGSALGQLSDSDSNFKVATARRAASGERRANTADRSICGGKKFRFFIEKSKLYSTPGVRRKRRTSGRGPEVCPLRLRYKQLTKDDMKNTVIRDYSLRIDFRIYAAHHTLYGGVKSSGNEN